MLIKFPNLNGKNFFSASIKVFRCVHSCCKDFQTSLIWLRAKNGHLIMRIKTRPIFNFNKNFLITNCSFACLPKNLKLVLKNAPYSLSKFVKLRLREKEKKDKCIYAIYSWRKHCSKLLGIFKTLFNSIFSLIWKKQICM